MKLKKKIILTLLTCLTLSACSQSENENIQPAEGVPTSLPVPVKEAGNDISAVVTPEGVAGKTPSAEKKVLTWMAPYGVARSNSEVYKEFNRLLDEKGYDFCVEFYTPGNDLADYIDLLYQEKENGTKIDVYSTGYDYYGGLYGDLIADDMCVCLNEYLEDEAGKTLYATKDENIWKSLSKDGKIYGVTGRGSVTNKNEGYVYINREIADKYEVDSQRMVIDQQYFWDMMEKVETGERAVEGFVPYIRLNAKLFDYPNGFEEFYGPIAIAQTDGCVKAVNIYEEPEVRNEIINSHRMWERKTMAQILTDEQTVNGNYFVVISPAEIKLPHAEMYKKSLTAINEQGGVTCIASWSEHVKEAFELIKAVHTDRELSELLAFGIEGVNYNVTDDVICKTNVAYEGRYAAAFLSNNLLLRASDYDISVSASMADEDTQRLCYGPLFGSPLDCRKIKNLLAKLGSTAGMVFPNYLKDNFWEGEDFEVKYEEGLAALQENGITQVIGEINRQLEERGLQ